MHYHVLVFVFFSSLAISQNCDNTLVGKVSDLHDNSVLSGATVIIKETQQAAYSDLEGVFTFKNLCNDKYTISISHPECITLEFEIRMTKDSTKTFKLEHHHEELNEVIVEGSSELQATETLVESKIDATTIDDNSSKTLGDVLERVSGVSSLNMGNTIVKPVINGLHSSRITIMNNGVRMEDQEWGVEHAPNIDVNSASTIRVVKGAGALQYSGDAIGGVVIIEPNRIPVKDTLYGKTTVNAQSNGRGGTISSRLTKSNAKGWFTSVNGTMKRYGDFEAPDYILSNTGAYERSASARLGLNRFNSGVEAYYSYYKNTLGILRASHIGGAQDQLTAINSGQPTVIRDFTYDIDRPRQEITHHLATLKGFKKFENLGKLSFRYDFQQNNRLEFDIRRGDDANKASIDLQLTTHAIALDLDSKLNDQIGLKAGFLGRYQKNFANPNTGVRRLIPDYDKYDLGVYGLTDIKLNTKLTIEGGIRLDYSLIDAFKFYRTSFWESRGYDVLFADLVIDVLGTQVLTNPKLDFLNFSGTLGTKYSFNTNNKLFFNLSLGTRTPNPSELFSEGLHHSASRIELGDLRFEAEKSHKISLTYQYEKERFALSVNPYLNVINDFILIQPTEVQQTIRGNFQVWEYMQTDAVFTGIDVDASYQINDLFSYTGQFAIVKAYDENDEPIISMPPANFRNEIVYKNSKLNNLLFALESQYVFRQNEFPDNNFDIFIPTTGENATVDVSSPPDAYHLINLRSSYDIQLNSKSTLVASLAVTNLFNSSYRDYLNNLRYYADDLGRNILLNFKINY
jgi:iron complex outermembrane receptor protein